ncbi:hypothetical protein FA378_10960 [Pseudomonas aeruginosa]|nr:hypothetical protein [Pseudomonas aeruginosa]MCO2762496.1 hypothetical protein [Pseudomonas aeruginosa]MCO2767715.1 hypothetical protein [Pseudomonas aeruginosa]
MAMNVARCIGCGCDDYHACWDEIAGQPCGWLRVDRGRGLGVCSICPEHTERWDAGDTSLDVPVEVDQGATEALMQKCRSAH